MSVGGVLECCKQGMGASDRLGERSLERER